MKEENTASQVILQQSDKILKNWIGPSPTAQE